MRQLEENKQYEKTLSAWTGYKVNMMDDFDIICESDYDFIELLLVFERQFQFDLLESEKQRQDFEKLEDFIEWAHSRPLQKDPVITPILSFGLS